jgi:uncharacterized damage-inducible protein DinB
MTAAGMRRYFDYNSWANERMFGALGAIPSGDYLADAKSSHGGLHGTMTHIVWAHQLWLLRWTGQPHDAAAAGLKAAVTFDRLRAYWLEVDRATGAFLAARLSDAFLAETFTMKTTKGEAFVHTYGEAMLHLVNHSSYHRGQLVTMLRQAGHAPPSTDFILYARSTPR